MLERNAVAGGAVASEELTQPGFLHDTFSAWHPLFKLSAAYGELGPELAERGLEYAETPEETTANVRPDGRAVIAYRDPAQTADGLDPRDRDTYMAEIAAFGATIGTVGQIFGTELFSPGAAKLAWQLSRALGRRRPLAFTADVLSSAQAWFETRFKGPEVGELYAPWALHTGLSPGCRRAAAFRRSRSPDRSTPSGCRSCSGGSVNFVRAFERLIEDHGGRVRTGVEAERIVTRGGHAVAVRRGRRADDGAPCA